jgi:ABC-type uncharacterized transport system involved in gliding motility auxiliary subunit
MGSEFFSEAPKPAAAANAPTEWGTSRRVLVAVNVAVMTVMALAVLVIVNYVSARHYKRFDCTRTDDFTLSGDSKAVLASLKKPVTIYIFPWASQDDPYVSQKVQVMGMVKDILEEFKFASKMITVLEVNPVAEPDRFEALRRTLKVESLQANDIVFSSENRQKSVSLDEIHQRQGGLLADPSSAAISSFRGEEAFTSALLSVSQDRKTVIYYTVGHDESDLDSSDSEPYGMSRFRRVLQDRENFELRKVMLASELKVPVDCDVLMIAGPHKKFTADEIGAVDAYLKGGGRVLVMLNLAWGEGDKTGIEEMLRRWHVGVDDDYVMQTRQCALPQGISAPLYNDFDPLNPITKMLFEKREQAGVILPAARSLARIAGGAEGLDIDPLLSSDPDSWGETDFESIRKNKVRRDGKDLPGCLPVAMAVHPKQGAAKPGEKSFRLVVIGDSEFVNNAVIEYFFNSDFMVNCIRWLAGQEQLISIKPRQPQDRRLMLNEEQLSRIFWVSILLIPLVMASFGFSVWFMRRR